jgi:tRNA pseudouridine55 synthase
MEELIRTKVSSFEIKDSLTLDEIRNKRDEGMLESILTPIDEMFSECQKVIVNEKWEALAYNGNPLYGKAIHCLDGEKVLDKSKVRVYDEKGNFIGLYQYSADRDEYSIVKMFYTKA